MTRRHADSTANLPTPIFDMHKVKIRDRKLGREDAHGQSWGPDETPGKRNTIEIDPRQSARSRMNTIIHEGLHQLDDTLSERTVRRFAAFLSDLLNRDGYRRIQK